MASSGVRPVAASETTQMRVRVLRSRPGLVQREDRFGRYLAELLHDRVGVDGFVDPIDEGGTHELAAHIVARAESLVLGHRWSSPASTAGIISRCFSEWLQARETGRGQE
jgi:hypothetical protein